MAGLDRILAIGPPKLVRFGCTTDSFEARWEDGMTGPEVDYVRARIDNEGFDYCFVSYSDFAEIKDEKFHKLRRAYVAAQKALEDYVGTGE
jgi:hypothetical protein